MTVYDIPNIEHCTVTPMASGRMFKIETNEGWYIHLNDGDVETENIWKGAVILPTAYDFSMVEIRPFAELPEDAEICGVVTDTETDILIEE